MDSIGPTRSPRSRVRPLPLPWQFRYCYEGGRKIVSRYAIVFLRAPAQPDGIRVGVVASRKVGGAVQRNRARRLLRETARALLPRWQNRQIWIVFVARESINGRKAVEVQAEIARALTENDGFNIE
jgi:ribonuclease P protein component